MERRLQTITPYLTANTAVPEMYIDIFEKIKLTIMLLTRLRKTLVQRNAPFDTIVKRVTDIFAFSCGEAELSLVNKINKPIFNPNDVKLLHSMLSLGHTDLWDKLSEENWKTPMYDFFFLFFPTLFLEFYYYYYY